MKLSPGSCLHRPPNSISRHGRGRRKAASGKIRKYHLRLFFSWPQDFSSYHKEIFTIPRSLLSQPSRPRCPRFSKCSVCFPGRSPEAPDRQAVAKTVQPGIEDCQKRLYKLSHKYLTTSGLRSVKTGVLAPITKRSLPSCTIQEI